MIIKNLSFTSKVRLPKASYPTTLSERVLLFLIVAFLPLENALPTLFDFSALYLVFLLLGGYVLLKRPRSSMLIALHPVFILSAIFIAMVVLLESAHPHSDYEIVGRMFEMLLGGIVVATVCRDEEALMAGLWGFLAAGLYLSIIFISAKYGKLQSASVHNFNEASMLRNEIYASTPLRGNLNSFAAFMAQGTVIALAMALAEHRAKWRWILGICSLGCFIGACMPMSRSGIIMAGAASCGILLTQRKNFFRLFVIMSMLISIIAILTPQATWTRFDVRLERKTDEPLEGRMRVYKAASDYIDEYAVLGVGSGNFWKIWGLRPGFSRSDKIVGPHNCFLAVLIYWGFLSLLFYAFIILKIYQSIPERCDKHPASLALLGIGICFLVLLMVTHSLYDKVFSLGLGFFCGNTLLDLAIWVCRNFRVKHRILYLVGQLGVGGLERQLMYLLKSLDKIKYCPAVIVWNFSPDEPYVKSLTKLKIPLYSLGSARTPTWLKLYRCHKLILKYQVELIHSYSFFTNIVAYLCSLNTKAYAIGSVRSSFWYDKKVTGMLLGRLSAYLPQSQIFNNQNALEIASKSFLCSKDKFLVKNALDLDEFFYTKMPDFCSINLLGIGQLIPVKRWDILIDMMRILQQRGCLVKLSIIGHGPLLGVLQEKVVKFNLQHVVTFLGYQEHVQDFLKKSHILVHVSAVEGLPNAVMEAMAMGRVVVAMDAGDIGVLLEHEKDGYVILNNNIEQFVDCLASLINSPNKLINVGVCARQKAEELFDLDRLVQQTLKVYCQCGWQP